MCHRCTGAMLIFSVLFRLQYMCGWSEHRSRDWITWPSSAAFLGTLAGSWIGNGIARIMNDLWPYGEWHRRQLKTLCQNISPTLILVFIISSLIKKWDSFVKDWFIYVKGSVIHRKKEVSLLLRHSSSACNSQGWHRLRSRTWTASRSSMQVA